MARRVTFAVLALLLAVTSLPLAAQAGVKRAKDLKEIKTPPLELRRPEPERRVLANGMIVFLLENHRLPLITMQAWSRAGALYEPGEQAGVAQLVGTMLRMGGTEKYPADRLDEELDFLAARVETFVGPDAGSATLDVPSSTFEPALALYADMLMHPAFAPEKLEVAKGQIKEQIRRQNDNPIQIAIREFIKLLYGENHPMARTPTFASVDRLKREHLVAYHHKYYRPNNLMVAVAGDFDGKKIEGQLLQAFAGWERADIEFPPVPEPPMTLEKSVNFARKAVPQSTIVVGHLGSRLSDPAHTSIEMMNSILGGSGFSSRIVETVRNDRGLAYFAGSFYQLGGRIPGVFIALSMTQADSSTVALGLLLDEIKKIREAPVGAEELATARNMRLNSEVFQYESPERVVNRLLTLEYYGLPKDYYEKGLEEAGKMDAATIQRAAREYLHPDGAKILVVGDVDKFQPPLSAFGEPVHEIELKDPTQM